ncbi:MAG: hypothetical protein G01um101448_366 [Parcubacteria group bacterium Gr01-1014_48]|nr:MAG: hypothetical protein Greene041614_242 [Parcubacteria group bacterium Greene0416_14]TSC74063.1 MAG: hypothetical protein G01um101448_366 [Parcubacteria group bacterium Gr01-1014_48]TSD01149.1 MAG: hypothetical protein Greene101415_452 [Parcubacteria group bacterium Greene1014_15]TSD08225.1 MAG: hypothetical protein Greene07144_295 [Parcubacteria group bacterium Greene0714_4]
MIQEQQKLVQNIFDTKALEKKSTRDGFGKGVVEVGEKDERIAVLYGWR